MRNAVNVVEPRDVQPGGALHGDAFATGSLVVLGDREDQVAELTEARIGAIRLVLAVVEVDRPSPQRDRGGRSALRPDDPRSA